MGCVHPQLLLALKLGSCAREARGAVGAGLHEVLRGILRCDGLALLVDDVLEQLLLLDLMSLHL